MFANTQNAKSLRSKRMFSLLGIRFTFKVLHENNKGSVYKQKKKGGASTRIAQYFRSLMKCFNSRGRALFTCCATHQVGNHSRAHLSVRPRITEWEASATVDRTYVRDRTRINRLYRSSVVFKSDSLLPV